VEALAEARHERGHAIQQQHIDLQNRHDSLTSDFRKARTEHRDELDRQARKLEREYKVKLARRDALVAREQQELQRRFDALNRMDNSSMVPMYQGDHAEPNTVQRRTSSHHEKGKGKSKDRFGVTGKGKSKNRFPVTGNKRGFSGGNPPSLKAQKTERSNNRRSISPRSPTRSPAGAGSSGGVITTHSRTGAGDIMAHDGTLNEDAFREYLAARQDHDDAEFVFSDSDGKEREATHGGDGTDDESDTGTVQTPPNSDTASDVESVDQQNQQDGPTGQGRK
jgi:hypothetical protein